MTFVECFSQYKNILMEGALGERLKREYHLDFDDNVAMASLVYSQTGRDALSELWGGYIDIAKRFNLPFVATTPTRRANRERIESSDFSEKIISDNVDFLREIQKKSGAKMFVGGLMGCKGDAYTAEGALPEKEAYDFHKWTCRHFLDAGVDFLYAGIMPSLFEAAGLAEAADETNLPYIISFTIQKNGTLIDGTKISDAITYIDENTRNKPLCYMTNCVHPKILFEALSQPFNQNAAVQKRFRGIQANTSPLSYAELDGSVDLKASSPKDFADDMIQLSKIVSIKIWGGCCGTDDRHIECLAEKLNTRG